MDVTKVLTFWFKEHGSGDWFSSSTAFDALVRERFASLHRDARRGELEAWRLNASGRLAEIIVLDQFSRNLYRGSAEQYTSDDMALVLAQVAINQGTDGDLTDEECMFLYMPFMHSESIRMQDRSLILFDALGLEGALDAAKKHRDIIVRFGRFPHRNALLGRESTQEEQAFLSEHGRGF